MEMRSFNGPWERAIISTIVSSAVLCFVPATYGTSRDKSLFNSRLVTSILYNVPFYL